MSEKTKSRIHFLILLNIVVVVAWYFWVSVRPKLIYAACSDVAEKSVSVGYRYNLAHDKEGDFRSQRDNCLRNATE